MIPAHPCGNHIQDILHEDSSAQEGHLSVTDLWIRHDVFTKQLFSRSAFSLHRSILVDQGRNFNLV
jgi:hypothetical protein